MRRWALRTLYRLLEWPAASRFARAAVTLLAMLRSTPEGWLSAFERRFVRSGWPGHGVNWVNLHASRFLSRVRQEMRGAPAPMRRRAMAPRRPLRVGMIGRFVGLLGFPPVLFERCPGTVHLTVFDVPYQNRRADYLRDSAHAYRSVELDASSRDGREIRDTACAIRDADLDLLINVNWKQDAYALLDIVDTACVANYCTGADLLHHPRVDIELLWQLQADNVLRGNRVWCTETRLPVGDSFVYQISGLYDARGLTIEPFRDWHERDPIIVTHGSLYKFAVPAFIACMLDILESDHGVEWILVGKDNGQALAAIQRAAAARGLGGRVHYEGAFSSVRNEHGVVDDPRWSRVQELLRRARLAPDPFPIGSGSARFEAYLLGAPSPHIGIDSGHGRPIATCELPVLLVPRNTVATIDGYRDLSRKCLSDAAFASAVQHDQLAAANNACEPNRWWSEIQEAYWHWRRTTEAA